MVKRDVYKYARLTTITKVKMNISAACDCIKELLAPTYVCMCSRVDYVSFKYRQDIALVFSVFARAKISAMNYA